MFAFSGSGAAGEVLEGVCSRLVAMSFGQRISQQISGGEDVRRLCARIFPENREQPNPIIQRNRPRMPASVMRCVVFAKQPALRFITAWQPRKLSGLEARGVEPLSSSLSAQTSTCLAGVSVLRSRMLHRHVADSRASARFDSPVNAVAPPTGQPAVHVSDASRRRPGNVAVN